VAEGRYDVVVLGGGSGGYVGAIRAAQLGMNVAVIERDKLGGTCLHRGCIPSKAYLQAAHLFTEMQHAGDFGLTTGEIGYDFGKIQSYREKVVTENWKGVQFLMKKNKITVVEGDGAIEGPGRIAVKGADGNGQTVVGENLILATGTRPRTLGIEVDGKRVFTSDNVWDAESMPKSVIILGGGVIGCEFASYYRAFGVEVTIVEMLDGLIPMMDADLGKEIGRQFGKRGITIMTGTTADPASVKSGDDGVELSVTVKGKQQTLKADYLLLAAAREATPIPGLESLGVETNRGYIVVGDGQRTSVANVYAAGDIAGGLMLAHKAYADGILAAETIAGKAQFKQVDMNRVPQPVFSFPQVAAVGITEQQARESGAEVEVGKFPFTANAKAKILGEPIGFVKVVADKHSGDVLGVHMVGPDVTEMISEAGLAKFLESTPWEMAYNIHPHPTLSEAIGEAAHATEGAPIHM
jgi:dihydrolipoamide dehydrogenase